MFKLGTTVGNNNNYAGGTSSAVRHIIHRFTDKASLDAWENSDESLKLIEGLVNVLWSI
ncbi:MAG: hypothetical protein WAK17_00145 [Candidatus Nitrosopolaris sp.]|jgi:antibiotic biosynthesis monooxygenase (ABM) superfamily enzyme